MTLGTVADGSRDGRLVIVSNDLSRAVYADGTAATMQEALDRWTKVEDLLNALAASLSGAPLPPRSTLRRTRRWHRCRAPGNGSTVRPLTATAI